MPLFLWIWHKFIQPLVDRYYGTDKQIKAKEEDQVRFFKAILFLFCVEYIPANQILKFKILDKKVLVINLVLIEKHRELKTISISYF